MKTVLQLLTALCLIGCLTGWPLPAPAASLPLDAQAAVIIAYQRIGDDANPDASLQTEQFRAHIQSIQNEGYSVMALPSLLDALQNNTPIPPRTVVLTFDGAYLSTFEHAIPLLLENKIPFTLFYASGPIDAAEPGLMTWDQLKGLTAHNTVTLGVMPMHYARLAQAPETEIRSALNKARQRHREQFGAEAAFFAYPFGEYSTRYQTLIQNSGFKAALGLQSGVVSPASNLYGLPRFTMTDRYGDLERFRTAVRALPLPASEIEPPDTMWDDTRTIGFSVPPGLSTQLSSLSCFASGQPDPVIKILGPRVELRLQEPLDDERVRINCTLPAGKDADDETPLWRWFGMLLVNQKNAPAEPDPADQNANNTGDDEEIINNPEPGALP